LVINPPQFLIAEHLIRIGYLGEVLVGPFLVVRVRIRMVLKGKFLKRLLYFLRIRVLFDAQNFVIVLIFLWGRLLGLLPLLLVSLLLATPAKLGLGQS
jgi:hypothetical protein